METTEKTKTKKKLEKTIDNLRKRQVNENKDLKNDNKMETANGENSNNIKRQKQKFISKTGNYKSRKLKTQKRQENKFTKQKFKSRTTVTSFEKITNQSH